MTSKIVGKCFRDSEIALKKLLKDGISSVFCNTYFCIYKNFLRVNPFILRLCDEVVHNDDIWSLFDHKHKRIKGRRFFKGLNIFLLPWIFSNNSYFAGVTSSAIMYKEL